MGLKGDFVRTELGDLPNDWRVESLGAVAAITTGKKDVNEGNPNGQFPFFTCSRTHTFSDSHSFNTEAILVAGNGDVGNLHYFNGKFEAYQRTYVLHRFSTDVRFIWHQLNHRLADSLGLGKIGSSIPYIKKENLTEFKFAVPSKAEEQRAIAEALSDVDALLSGLDRLIAKKRDLKQAAMQQLLTGQTRLPGFQGEWRDTTFSDLVKHHSGNSTLIKGKLSPANAVGLYPAYSASGQDVWHPQYEHDGEAIVVSAVGSRCGKAFRATGRWSAIANTHVVWPVESKVDIRFLMRFLDDEDFWQKSGTGQPFVLFPKSFSQRLRLPSLEEQIAIATVLSDMDAELAALEARRDKTRLLKQGMMQELLTGRTRLV